MAANGATASITLNFGGTTASPSGQEADLAIDAGGDLLAIDPGGDALIVSPGRSWTGSIVGASVAIAGATAAFVWPISAVITILTETGVNILTEGGGTIAMEM